MKLIKTIIPIIIILIIIYASYLNLGRFLDATVEPTKTDLLVCLGGGDYKIRIKKTLELYKEDFLNSNTILLTGYANTKKEIENGILEDKRISFIKDNDYNYINIVINKELRNTAEEIKYIKNYMIENNYESVTIISEPPHSRRIMLFFSLLTVEADDNLRINIVGANYRNWNDGNKYYDKKYTKKYVFIEVVKIFYGLFAYGILNKLGLLEWFEEIFLEEILSNRIYLTKSIDFII